jgi:hypothetical protein
MKFVKRFSFALVFCLAASISVWGQTALPTAKVVYVVTGNSEVYAVIPGGTAKALISPSEYSGATFNSLTVGPDNVDSDNPVNEQGNYNFFLYACDNTNNNIIRLEFNKSNPASLTSSTLVTTDISKPVCGRVGSNVEVDPSSTTNDTTTTSGNLYVSSGSDVYEITDASSTPNGGPFAVSSSPVITGSSTGNSLSGLTQKNSGDMLAVGPAGSILRSQYSGGGLPFASTFSSYITDANDLTAPLGIARAQALEQNDSKAVINDFFVVNGEKNNAVFGFDPSSSTSASFCSYSFSKGGVNPTSIAASEDNFLYVGVSGSSSNKWSVQILNAACAAQSSIDLSGLADLSTGASSDGPSAVAIPPVAAPPSFTNSALDPSSGATVTNYNFGSSLLQLAPGGCTITDVNQTPVSLSFLQGLTNSVPESTTTDSGATWFGGAPSPGNGESGFGTLYSFTPSANCTAAKVETTILVGGFFDPSVTNPRIIHCDDNFQSCDLIDPAGNWPEGGYLTDDAGTYGGKTPTFGSKYFVVNGNITTGSDRGYFCGFGNPLIGTHSLSGPMSVFSIGQGVSVKFKLGADQSCSNGNFITDAYALLSIVQVRDGQGNTVFQPIQINTQGSSTDNPPIFKVNSSSQNYQFSLDLTGYAPGIYELSVTFLTNNAPAAYTYFQVQ